jgi:hypothetical protein
VSKEVVQPALIILPGAAGNRKRRLEIVAGTGVTLDVVEEADQIKLTVNASGGGAPATTVTDETAWGIVPDVGVGTDFAREDHTHGTPTAPTAASVGAIASGVLTTNEDMLIRRGGAPARLGVGAEGAVPRVVGGIIVWTALSFSMALDGEGCLEPVIQQGSPARTS